MVQIVSENKSIQAVSKVKPRSHKIIALMSRFSTVPLNSPMSRSTELLKGKTSHASMYWKLVIIIIIIINTAKRKQYNYEA